MKSRFTAAAFTALCLLFTASVVRSQSHPVPFVNQPLVPDAVVPGGQAFTLTVNGTGFVFGAVVNWNGSPRSTAFVSSSQLTAQITSADIATRSTASVTVVNPPLGGGTSNVVSLVVTLPESSLNTYLTSSFAAGNQPFFVAVGDFNGDGKQDLAVSNTLTRTLSIFLGDGTGNFTLASSPATGRNPTYVAVGDFNADDNMDLAVANSDDNTLSILLGDGKGNFTLASTPATGSFPYSIATGDFNGDGHLDLATGNFSSGDISVLLGDGTGHFTLASTPLTNGIPRSITTGDFNGDGHLDLAAVDAGGAGVTILLGDGTGHFHIFSHPPTGNCPTSITAADFNGDGKLDLAVTNEIDGTVSILLGDGTGHFRLAFSPVVTIPNTVVAGDINGDGILDLAVGNFFSGSPFSILLGKGNGNFTPAAGPAGGSVPNVVALGDFNDDGRLDFAVVDAPGKKVSIVLQSPVALSPNSLRFPPTLIGTTSDPITVHLTNMDSVPLIISSIAASGPFAQTNTCGHSLGAGASCPIRVTFSPTFENRQVGKLTITDNAPASPQFAPLRGFGTVVELVPSQLRFGDVVVGQTSNPKTITLTNTGSTTLNINGITIFNGDVNDFSQTNTCGSSVLPGGSCTISVTFKPTVKGHRSSSVKVFDDGGGTSQRVSLSGTGI
jgi:archaellum component FlaF (FlaF/FlaG flagellin family)